MSYYNGLNFLESKTKVLELSNDLGARIAVCPFWNGRVMTSTCTGLEGDSYGLIDVRGIENTTRDANQLFRFGGENQFSLSPDRGRFSVCYSTDQDSDEFYLSKFPLKKGLGGPVGYTEGPFDVDFGVAEGLLRMRRSISMNNLSGAKFDLDVIRKIRLLNNTQLSEIFSDNAFVALEHPEVSYVAYETSNTLVNSGSTFSQDSGLVSIRMRSMLNASPFSAMIVPFRNGSEDELGPPIQSDFFGVSSRHRLHILPNAALMRADGLMRGHIGVSRHRTLSSCAAINFHSGLLSIIAFNLPSDPMGCRYMSNDFFEPGNGFEAPLDFLSSRKHFLRTLFEHNSEPGSAGFQPASRSEKNDANGLRPPTGRQDACDPGSGKTSLLSKLAKERKENDPYSGEVIRAYNHGPAQRNCEDIVFPYFELDTFSPAKELRKGESVTHTQYTIHICADIGTISYLVQSLFDLDTQQIFDAVVR